MCFSFVVMVRGVKNLLEWFFMFGFVFVFSRSVNSLLLLFVWYVRSNGVFFWLFWLLMWVFVLSKFFVILVFEIVMVIWRVDLLWIGLVELMLVLWEMSSCIIFWWWLRIVYWRSVCWCLKFCVLICMLVFSLWVSIDRFFVVVMSMISLFLWFGFIIVICRFYSFWGRI